MAPGTNTNLNLSNAQLLQQQQNLLLLKQQQEVINSIKTPTQYTNANSTNFGSVNKISYNPPSPQKPKQPETPVLQMEEDLLNIDLLNGPQV